MDFEAMWRDMSATASDILPKILLAVAIAIAAYIIGKIIAAGARYAVKKSGLGSDDKARAQLGDAIGKALFWVTILIALPLILEAIEMNGLMAPVQEMSTEFLAFLPNLVGAGLIFGIGWVIATIVKRTVTSVLEAAQADKLAATSGLGSVTGETGIAKFAGTLVFVLIIIPIAIAALDALGVESIAGPAREMLQSVLNAIPNIFAAAVVILLAFLIGRFAGQALETLLPTLGVDRVGDRLGLTSEVTGGASLSKVAGTLAFIAIMVFGLIEGAKLLNFAIVSEMLSHILELGGRVLLGAVIIGFGVIIADFIAETLRKSKDGSQAAGFVKVAIIVLASAMGLRQMGVANEIINTGFTLMIGAFAVGAAIAIGLGGRDTAGRLLEKWTKDM